VTQDPYQILGVSRSASADDIRKAFRKLAKANHPDVNPGNAAAEERFKRVSAAFDILGDPEKKTKFDRGEIDADGRESMRGFGGGSPFGGGGSPFGARNAGRRAGPGGGPGGGAGAGFGGGDFDDILAEMFGNRAGAGAGPQGGFGARGPVKGDDLRLRLEIDLEEAIKGGPKRISLPSGATLDLTIPAAARDGQTLRLRGKGEAGRQGGPTGDALIELAIRPHPLYRRDGADLSMDLPISVPDAILGARVDAPTPDGPVSLTVPPRANSGQTLRLKGRGATDAQGRRGDLLARLVVMLPDMPDDALEAFAREWRDKRPYQPRRKV
jgi:DnaJ-class molecular chaperone